MNQELSKPVTEPRARLLMLEEGGPTTESSGRSIASSAPPTPEASRIRAVRTEALPDALLVIDSSGVTRYASPKAGVMFGTSPEALLSKPFGLPFVVGSMTEIDVLRENGESGVAELRVSLALWDDEPAYVALLRDVTDRVRVTDALRSQAHWAQALGDVALLASRSDDEESLARGVCSILSEIGRFDRTWIVVTDQPAPEPGRLLASRGFAPEDGHRPDALVEAWNRARRERKPSDSLERSATIRREDASSNRPPSPESRLLGHKVEVSVPLLAAGRELGTLSVASTFLSTVESAEIRTLQHIAEVLAHGLSCLARQREQAEWNEALQASPIVLYSTDATRDRPSPVWAGGNPSRLLGQARASTPDGWAASVFEADRERVFAAHRNPDPSGSDVLSYRLVHSDGSIRRVHDYRTPIRDDSGRVVRFAGALIDESDRSRVASQKDWDALVDAMGSFAKNAVPEIESALTRILTRAEWLLTSRISMKGVAESAGAIWALADRTKLLCQRMAACADDGLLSKEAVQPNDWLANLVPGFAQALPSHLSVRSLFAPSLPRLHIDPGLLEFALQHLLKAAGASLPAGGNVQLTTQHIPNHGVACHDSPPAESTASYVCVTVGYGGHGTDALEARRWFATDCTAVDPSDARAFELAIAACVARRHGGWMSIHRTGSGATAYQMYLPVPS